MGELCIIRNKSLHPEDSCQHLLCPVGFCGILCQTLTTENIHCTLIQVSSVLLKIMNLKKQVWPTQKSIKRLIKLGCLVQWGASIVNMANTKVSFSLAQFCTFVPFFRLQPDMYVFISTDSMLPGLVVKQTDGGEYLESTSQIGRRYFLWHCSFSAHGYSVHYSCSFQWIPVGALHTDNKHKILSNFVID